MQTEDNLFDIIDITLPSSHLKNEMIATLLGMSATIVFELHQNKVDFSKYSMDFHYVAANLAANVLALRFGKIEKTKIDYQDLSKFKSDDLKGKLLHLLKLVIEQYKDELDL